MTSITTRVEANALHRIEWSDVADLRSRLIVEGIKLSLPFVLLSCLWSFAVHGVHSKFWLFLSALTAVGIQVGAHTLASLMIVPGQRRLSEWINLIARSEKLFLEKIGLGSLVANLHGTAQFLDRMRESAPAAKLQMMRELAGTPIRVRTPDGCELSAVVFADGGPANNPRGCLLYCAGNAELSAFNRTWAAFARKHKLSVVIFDYRGVGDSTGTMTRHGGVIDAASMIAFCTSPQGLNYAQEDLLVFGHSIGGGFATEAVLSFPEVNIINDRSFGKLSETAWFHLYPACVSPDAAVSESLAMRFARWLIHDAVRHVAAWELDGAKHWLHIRNKKKALMFHAADRIIPFPTQLRTHLVNYHGTSCFDGFGGGRAAGTVREGPSLPIEEVAMARGYKPSCYGLGCIIQLGTDAAAKAATKGQRVHGLDSHYGTTSAASNNSNNTNGGEDDPHNRDLSYTEEQRFFSHVVEPMLQYTSIVGGIVKEAPAYINL